MELIAFFPYKELEQFDDGCSGVISNAILSLRIPVYAFYAYLFYGEVLRPMQFVGGSIVVIAILIVAGVKMAKYFWMRKKRKEEEVEKTPLTKKEIND